jgi:hypothetical protein
VNGILDQQDISIYNKNSNVGGIGSVLTSDGSGGWDWKPVSSTTNASTVNVTTDDTNTVRYILFTNLVNTGTNGQALIDRTGDGLGGTNGMYYNPSTCTLSVKYTNTQASSALTADVATGADSYIGNSTSDDGYVIFQHKTTNRLFHTEFDFSYDETSTTYSIADILYNTPNIYPVGDNARNLGGSTARWGTIYAATGTINTSDEREKNTIQQSNLGLNFIKKLNPVSYKFNIKENLTSKDDGNNLVLTPIAGERTHYGFISQEVKETLDQIGIEDFAGWILGDKDDPNSIQGLRYSEFIAPSIKAIQEQQEIIEAQKIEIENLKSRLDAAGIP